jgi:prepilin-type N-terminal cleavage/methylation domain-containing protein
MERKSHTQSGFTLVEMMISIGIIAILASITVPNLLSHRAVTNESAVVATLRAISQAEYQFRSQGLVDINQDAGPEFGTLREMTGQDPLRGLPYPISNNLLSSSLGSLDAAGQLRKNGYIIQLFLPNAAGEGISAIAANNGNFDPSLAMDYWTCLAWPIKAGSTGRHTFFMNQQGQVLKTQSMVYSGSTAPEPGAALKGSTPKQIDSQELAVQAVGADGNNWMPVH